MDRPTVLLDVDGCLANFIDAALSILNPMAGTLFMHDDVHTWELFDSLPPELQLYKSPVYDRMKSAGGCMSIQPYAHAKDGVRRVRELADIVIVTSPFQGSATWTSEREEWLEKHFDIPHTDVIHAKKKELVRGDFFVDDKPEHLRAWRSRCRGKAIWWRNPQFSGELPGYVLCTQNWDDVIAAIEKWLEGKK